MSILSYFSPRLLPLTNSEGNAQRRGGSNGASTGNKPRGVDAIPASGRGPTTFVVPRRVLRFDRVSLKGDRAKALKAARLAVQLGSEGASYRTRIVEYPSDGNSATVWSWPEDLVEARSDDLIAPISLPEPLARQSVAPAPGANNVRLVTCLEGYEGQVWRDGALCASRWWADVPGKDEWGLFLRSSRHPLNAESLAARTPVDVPWKSDLTLIDRDPENLTRRFSPSFLAALIGALLLVLVANQGVRWAGASLMAAQNAATRAAALEEARPAIAARRSALAALTETDRLSQVFPDTKASEIIVTVLRELPADDVELTEIKLFDGEFEFVGVNLADDARADLIARLEASPVLSGVYIEGSGGESLFRVRGNTNSLQPTIVQGPLNGSRNGGAS
ncbi:MAG: hypothetical protein AAFY84_12630 [Pseudomonadota bacterium]